MLAVGDSEAAALEQPGTPARISALPIPRMFYERNGARAFVATAANAGIVLAAGPIAYAIDAWPAYLVAFVLVGARAQALYILQHECMHWLLFKTRGGNDLCGLLLSGTLGTGLGFGRFYHFKHHRRVGHADDPNLMWHDSRLHRPGWSTFWFFAAQLAGARLLGLLTRLLPGAHRAQRSSAPGMVQNPVGTKTMMVDLAAMALIQAVIFGGMWAASAWWVYFALFVLPLVTLTSFFEALRSFSEHVLPGERGSTPAEDARLFFMDAGGIERFFISQFGFHYHHLHHLYPGVVTFELRHLHRWLSEHDPEYSTKFVRRAGYLRTALCYVLKQPLAPADAL